VPRAKSTPTPPALAGKGKKHTSSLPPAKTPKKRKIVEKKIGPKKKLAYETTYEEAKEHSRQAVKDPFKPKEPEKRIPIDGPLASKLYDSLSAVAKRKVKPPSDFDRTLIKARQKIKKCGKTVP
jgi:hypothetical protein